MAALEFTVIKKLTVLSTVALIGVASLAATDAEARSRRGHGGQWRLA